MRARSIKPGFYTNEALAECSIWARFIFPGLWMLADREGRMEYRPKRMKAELLPYDGEDMRLLIDELEEHGLVNIYKVDGKEYLCIPGFTKHQNPHIKEKPSVLPPCPKDGESVGTEQAPDKHYIHNGQAQCKHGAKPVQVPDRHQFSTGLALLTPDSGLLTPDILNPGTNNPSSAEIYNRARECPGSQGDCSLPDPVHLPDLASDPGIEFQELRQFYDANARQEAPLSGFVEYKQLRASKQWPGLARITDAIAKQQAVDPEGWQQFAPGLGKFLKEHWWRKEPVPPRNKASPCLTPAQQKAQNLDNMAKFVLAADKELKNGNKTTHLSGTGKNGYALPPGTHPQ